MSEDTEPPEDWPFSAWLWREEQAVSAGVIVVCAVVIVVCVVTALIRFVCWAVPW